MTHRGKLPTPSFKGRSDAGSMWCSQGFGTGHLPGGSWSAERGAVTGDESCGGEFLWWLSGLRTQRVVPENVGLFPVLAWLVKDSSLLQAMV